MRRTLLCLAGAAALVAPLAACGDDDDTGTAGTTTTAETSGGRAAELTVHAEDSLKFDESSYDVAAGDIAISYVNDGAQPHTLLIDGADGFKLSVGSHETDDGTVQLPAGTYRMYCDVAGHETAGMVADLNVA